MFDGRDQPRSFRERGVAAPFTTPRLTRARLRIAPGRRPAVLELVIPNTTRGRGYYVVPWGERAGFCRITLFDTFLGDALAARDDLERLCPAMVRQEARAVARQGYAGQEAAEAAQRMQEQDIRRRAALEAHLGELPSPHGARLIALLGELHAPDSDPAPLPRLTEAVGALGEALTGWKAAPGDGSELAEMAWMLAIAAAHMQEGARRLMRAPLLQIRQADALLRAWTSDPEGLEAELSRVDWLLDGWERMVLLWRDAGGIGPGLLREYASLLPVLPDEADAWLGLESGSCAQAVRRPPQRPPREEDAGQIFEQTLRNERLWRLIA